MSTILPFLLLFFLPFTTPTPYLSPKTLPQNFHSMLTTFKIYIYTPQTPFNYTSTPLSIFHNTLLHSPFLTNDPTQAHFFFIPFPPSISTRSLARVIKHIRTNYPFWDKSLGADHFFVSLTGIDYSSDRNLLELKKNSVQVSIFPVKTGFFIPHKDVTLPPVRFFDQRLDLLPKKVKPFLGFLKWDEKMDLGLKLVNEIKKMDGFFVGNNLSNVGVSKFCLFLYYSDDVDWIVEAMGNGCVPVVIVDRAIQDLPLMDVLKWEDMVLVVKVESGVRLREVLSSVSEERYKEMRALGVAASKHLRWKEREEGTETDVETCGAFGMVMYQLWLRRHVIRYERRDVV